MLDQTVTTAKTPKAAKAPRSSKAPTPKLHAPSRKDKLSTHFMGASLERWRIENALTRVEGAEAFGLPIAKWYSLVSKENAKKPLSDVVLAMCRVLYIMEPKSAPTQGRPDLKAFYEWLGLGDTAEGKNHFAWLIGRKPPSVYRLLSAQGKPSRPLIRYIEALLQLGLDPKQTLRIMEAVAKEVYVKEPQD
jgi:hypothetical protein